MKERISIIGAIGALVLAAALGGPALAGPRANTTQVGSLLIFPKITVDPADSPGSSNTLIEISNDQSAPVHIKCWYVNERKGRVDFNFDLSSKQTASWEVLTGTGDIAAPLFPSDAPFPGPGNIFKGELICFAVDAGAQNQIAWNHLVGTATVVSSGDADATQPHQAHRYNAFAFMARATVGQPADGTIQGVPGQLVLSGNGDGTYDACPVYNIANFMPGGGPPLNDVSTIDNDLVVVSCKQDLRQDFVLHTTKLDFKVWNAHENSFTGSYLCVDSVASFAIGTSGGNVSPVKNPTNFDFSTLQTRNARFTVQGIFSSVCDPTIFGTTEPTGLLAVLQSSVRINGDVNESQELGSTTFAAGYDRTGFVTWNPHGPALSSKKPKR